MYPNEVDEEDDSFKGEELSGLQELVTAMDISCTAEEFFLAAVDEIQICSGFFDPADSKWREKAREEILKNHESISTESTPALNVIARGRLGRRGGSNHKGTSH